jgi:hypothetical protein
MKYFYSWLIFLALGILLYSSNLNRMPRGIHAWGQADRLSLAINFLEEDNLFAPATHCLQTEGGRVGCEIALIPYMAAKISSFLNLPNYLPFIYRFLNWSILSLGFMFFIRILSIHFRFSWMHSCLLSLFLFSSPVLLFYGYNFLMDAPAFSLVIISLYYIIEWTKTKKVKPYLIALSLLSLASVLKNSTLIFWGALILSALVFTLRHFKTLNNRPAYLFSFLVAFVFLILLSYYTYYYYILFNKENWSFVFLSETRPLQIPEEIGLLGYALKKWFLEYFTWYQWFALLLATVALIYSLIKKGFKILPTEFWLFISSAFAALLVLLVVLGKQFPDHDYYAIATLFPFIFLLWIVYLWIANGQLFSGIISGTALLALVLLNFKVVYSQIQHRSQPTYIKGEIYAYNEPEWLKNGGNIIDSLGIEKKAVFMVPYAYSMNIHLVYINRKGLIVTEEEMNREQDFYEKWINQIQPQYMLLQNKYVDSFFTRRPNFDNYTDLIYSNSDFRIYKFKENMPDFILNY